MKKILILLVMLLGVCLVSVPVYAEEEQEQPVIEEENDSAEKWFAEFFSAEKVAMYISWVAYIGTIIGLVAKVKQLKQTNNLTLKNVVTNNTKSAFNIKYMQDLTEKNISKREHLFLQKNKQTTVYLPLNVYPLHFYNEDGGEIVNDSITWTYEKYGENQNKITIVNTQGTINALMTTIKVY